LEAAAQLTVVFAAHGAVDFAQLTVAALEALGNPDAPSDVLLRLDLTIDHLLIDEFQDTSVAQFRLVELLTAGWTLGDGRTIFAVGDPMQSIYKFRDAEVRLFLEARAKGRIGTVPVQFIDLARNFRSQGHLVAWANRAFPRILGERNEPWRGAVAFAAAAETHPASGDGPPTLEVVGNRADEAARVVEHVNDAIAAGARDVAILVRARGDLDEILPALRAASVPFAAVELDALGMRQAVLDLLSLTHALLQPADRLASFSVLRAPWCGLVLADLCVVGKHLEYGLANLFKRLDSIEGLSDDGRARVARIANVLAPAFGEQGRVDIADRVRGAWLALGGPATIDDAVDFPAVEDFLALLRAHAAGGDIDDWQALQDELAVRFVTSAEEDSAGCRPNGCRDSRPATERIATGRAASRGHVARRLPERRSRNGGRSCPASPRLARHRVMRFAQGLGYDGFTAVPSDPAGGSDAAVEGAAGTCPLGHRARIEF